MLTEVDKRIKKGKQRLSLSVKDALVVVFKKIFFFFLFNVRYFEIICYISFVLWFVSF